MRIVGDSAAFTPPTDARCPMRILTVSVFPAPDSPDTRIDWEPMSPARPRYAAADTAYLRKARGRTREREKSEAGGERRGHFVS